MKLAAALVLGFDGRPASVVSPISVPGVPIKKTALVKYHFHLRKDNELALKPDETITVLNAIDEEWWLGTNSQGETGSFPRMFVEMADGEEPALEDAIHNSNAVEVSQTPEVSTFSSFSSFTESPVTD